MLKNFQPKGARPQAMRPAPAPSPVQEMRAENEAAPRANSKGTIAALIGIAVTAITMQGALASDLARYAAFGTGASLAVSLFMDVRAGGIRNTIRADVMAIMAFYFLTFVEFYFPQPNFDQMLGLESTRRGLYAVLLGLCGMLIGRHWWHPKSPPLLQLRTYIIPPGILVGLFWACFIMGFAHMIIAVNFDVPEMIHQMMEPRFTQPWARGRLGDWKALLVELGLFIYLLPPLAGIIMARRGRYSVGQIVPIMLALSFALFFAFASGTRNVLASYLVTFLIGYAFSLPVERRKETLTVAAICAGVMVIGTPIMLLFRNEGLNAYLSGEYVPPQNEEETLFVDYNLYAVAMIMSAIPARIPYLGFEIPYTALVRPIPRALWPGKPEGLSYTIEDALGVEGMTISATFVGESYMAGGYVAIGIAGLLFGAMLGWWSHLNSIRNSELGILIYASGFFAAVISMRSMFSLTTALLPTAAAIVLGGFVVRQLVAMDAQRRRLAEGAGGRLPPQRLDRRP